VVRDLDGDLLHDGTVVHVVTLAAAKVRAMRVEPDQG
jgi:hypothetical protein